MTLSGPITERHSCLRDQTSRRVTLPLNMSLCSQNGQSQDPLNFRFRNFTYCIMSPDERRRQLFATMQNRRYHGTPLPLLFPPLSQFSPLTHTLHIINLTVYMPNTQIIRLNNIIRRNYYNQIDISQ